MKTAPEAADTDVPLRVDLEGALIRCDISVESFFALLQINPLCVFLLPFWLLKGKAYFKRKLAERAGLSANQLLYREEILDFLRQQRLSGRKILLVSGSDEKTAHRVAEHLGLLDTVLANNETVVLRGSQKPVPLPEAHAAKDFDYVACPKADPSIWPHVRRAILVNPSRHLESAARRSAEVERVFRDDQADWRAFLRAIRLYQWPKNLLVFVPLIASHQFTNAWALGQAFTAFLSFGLCASGTYVLNDLIDLPFDRIHPKKRLRPFASGAISAHHGIWLIPALLAPSFGIASLLPADFVALLVTYVLITLLYSLRLKRVVLMDVMILSAHYVIRVVAGAAAISVELSFWLLAFSGFLFLSLAMTKRYSELLESKENGAPTAGGRGYRPVDLETLMCLGTASGYAAVMVLAFYVNSENVRKLYGHPNAIWFFCPLLLYWVGRIWIAARRGEVHEDPLMFALRDRMSLWVGAAGVLIFFVAM